uniref:RNA-directed DNA polymerase n=1 Tax=Tetranychus urticae TaxID=32264 RepID=A0A158P4I8_TETUR
MTETNISPVLGLTTKKTKSNSTMQQLIHIPNFSADGEDVLDWLDHFESAAAALEWDEDTKLKAIPAYLTGTASRWYRCCIKPLKENEIPKTFEDFKLKFVSGLSPAGYRKSLIKELNEKKQRPDQSAIAYSYEVKDLCKRIYPELKEDIINSFIDRGLNSNIRTRLDLLTADKDTDFISKVTLAERSLLSRNGDLGDSDEKELLVKDKISSLSKQLNEITERLDCLNFQHDMRRRSMDQSQMYQPPVREARNRYANRPPRTYVHPRLSNRTEERSRQFTPRTIPRCYKCGQEGHVQVNCNQYSTTPKQVNWYPNSSTNNNWRRNDNETNYSQSQSNRDLSRSPPRSNRPSRQRTPPRRYRSPSPRPVRSQSETPSPVRRPRGRPRSRTPSPTRKTRSKSPEKRTKVVKTVYTEVNGSEEDLPNLVGAVIFNLSKSKRSKLIFTEIEIKGKNVMSLVDTGAEVSIITQRLVYKLQLDYHRYRGPIHLTAGNTPLKVLGESNIKITVKCRSKSMEIKTPVIVVDYLPADIKFVMGMNILEVGKFRIDCGEKQIKFPSNPKLKFNKFENWEKSLDSLESNNAITTDTFSSEISDSSFLTNFGDEILVEENTNSFLISNMISELKLEVNEDLEKETLRQLNDLISNYRVVFAATSEELGFSRVYTHRIETGNHPPISQKPYRMSEQKRLIAEKSINELMDDGIVIPSCSPWSSPIVLVAKKGTDEVRLCVDYRKLNEITVKDKFPLPNIQDYLDSLQGMKYFSLLDLRSGYHQMAMDPLDQQKTAFVTPSGLYEYTRLPFGLANGPASFMRMMSIVLSGLIYNTCLIFIDDLLIFSKTEDEHLNRCEIIFQRLKDAGLTLKPNKCSFFKRKILYLGHVVSEQGQEVDPEKIRKVQHFPTPHTVRDIKSFVALCSYYRRFIKDFAEIARPLTNLTRKDLPFEWGQEQEEAFNQLKLKLTTPPVLAHYDPIKETQLRVDASGYGLGAILLQKDDNGFHPICYASRLLRGAELNYPVSDKECLAIVWAVQKFRVYLEGIHFVVVTDHCALCHIHSKKQLPSRLQRYAMALQSFDFTVQYKSGTKHKDADCLSRYPVDDNVLDNAKDECEELFSLLVLQSIQEEIDLIEQQRQDNSIVKILELLDTYATLNQKERKRLEKFRIQNGILYRLTNNQYGETWNIVLPKSLISKVLNEYHDSILSGHPGMFSTYNKIKQNYWWPHMTRDIMNYVKSCLICQLDKRGSGTLEAPLKSIVVNDAFNKIGIDLIGPFPVSKKNKYIIICTDYYTRWVEVQAIQNMTAESTATFLIQSIFLRHGCPRTIVSDQGRNFISSVVKEVKDFLASTWSFSTTYHPATNGLTEKANQTICNMLTHYCQNENKTKWAEILPVMGFAYNTSVNQATKASPFYLLYGRQPTLPIDIFINNKNFASLPEEVRTTIKKWSQIKDTVQMYSNEAKENQKMQHDKKKLRQFSIGDEVLYKNQTGPKKLNARFTGPYKVIDKMGQTTYKILHMNQKDRVRRVHGNQLKPYHSPLSISLILLIGLICLVTGQINPFITGDTILWKETEHKPRKATQEIRIILAFSNPCKEMLKFQEDEYGEIKNRSNPLNGCPLRNLQCPVIRKYLFTIQDYCSEFIEEKYIQPIRFIRTVIPKEEKSPQLLKREIITLTTVAVGTTAVVVGGVVLTGVAYMYKSVMTPEIDFRPVIESITAQNAEYRKALKTQNEYLINVTKILNKQQQQIDVLKKLIPIVSFQAADVVTGSNTQLILMQKFNESISKPKPTIDPNFFTSLKINLSCDDCDLSVIERISVKVYKEDKYPILSLNFTTFRQDQVTKIFQADPFLLYKTNATHTCKSRYRGPEYLLVNTTTYQFCEIDGSELKSPNPVFAKVTTCPNKFNRTQLWRDEHCVSKNVNETIVAEKIQVKNMGDHYLIHCAGHKIEIYSGTYLCPNQVIKLSKYTNFSIDDMKYTSNNFFIYVRGPRVTEHTQAINLKLFQPVYQEINIAPLEFELLEAAQEKVLSSFEQINLIWRFDYVKWISIALLITICFLLCTLSVRFMLTPKRTVYSIVNDEKEKQKSKPKKGQKERVQLHECY